MNLSKITGKKTKITLEDLTRRKEEVIREIRLEEEIMSEYSQRIFAPFLPSMNNNPVLKKFNTGLAIFDGVMLGMKIFKGIRKIFKKS
ncbi:hypothetical protein [Bacteroides sp. 224]|uniref:hypothetical protein n=1 Tax=Bacteroides sp. 224 TaxID=2302936 RepID=UPI0013D40935|nr:hypothetical protein [Bacteroides sp. 224]NDV66218.1 hypothetical protein [Bacteroides sp. 224]